MMDKERLLTRLVRGTVALACVVALAPSVHAAIQTGVFHTASIAPAVAIPATVVKQITMWDSTMQRAFPNNADGASEVVSLGTNEHLAIDCREVFDTATNIVGAYLYLYNVAGADQAYAAWTAFLLTNDWEELSASWSNRAEGLPWLAAGGDFAGAPSVGGTILCTNEEYHVFNVTALLAAYATNSFSYAGLLLRSDDEEGADPVYMSADNALDDAAQQPFLVVVYDDNVNVLTDAVPLGFAIVLSNNYREAVLTWTNGTVADVIVCTNQYYTTDPSQWHTRVTSVTGVYVDAEATNSPSVYYRLVSRPTGTFTSTYDLAKMTVQVPGNNQLSYLNPPFIMESRSVSNIFGGQLMPGGVSSSDRVFAQTTLGGAFASVARYRQGTPPYWDYQNPTYADNIPIEHGIAVRCASNTTLSFVGRVPLYDSYVTRPVAGGNMLTYLSLPSCSPVLWTNVVVNQLTPGGVSSSDRCFAQAAYGSPFGSVASYRTGTPPYWNFQNAYFTNAWPLMSFAVRAAQATNVFTLHLK